MKHILNKTKLHSERYTLINESMGCAGDPAYYPTYKYSIANGIDRGNGYQGYMSLTCALKEFQYLPKEAKRNLIIILSTGGYKQYLNEIGIDYLHLY